METFINNKITQKTLQIIRYIGFKWRFFNLFIYGLSFMLLSFNNYKIVDEESLEVTIGDLPEKTSASQIDIELKFNEIINDLSNGDVTINSDNLVNEPVMNITKVDEYNYTISLTNIDLNDTSPSGKITFQISESNTITSVDNNTLSKDQITNSTKEIIIISPEPAENVTLTIADKTHNSITVKWTNSTTPQKAYQHLLIISETENNGSISIVDQTFQNDKLTFGNEGYRAHNISNTVEEFMIMNLDFDKDYYLYLYPYTNDGENVDYKIAEEVNYIKITTKVLSSNTTLKIDDNNNDISSKESKNVIFTFKIADDEGLNDSDSAPTLINKITINRATTDSNDWKSIIMGVSLERSNPSEHLTENITINENSIIIDNIPYADENSIGRINDDSEAEFKLYVWLFTKDNFPDDIDNTELHFLLNGANISTESNSSKILSNSEISSTNKIVVEATKLEFVRQPSESSFVGKNFARQPEIIATDNAGNIDKDFKEECSKIRIVDESSSIAGSSSPLVIINDSDNTPIANNELNFNEGKITFANYKIKYTSTATDTRLKIELVNKDGCYQNEIAPIYSEQFSVSTGKGVGFSIINDNISENIAPNDDVEVFEFKITDDDLTTQDDGLPTRLSQITITKGSTDELDWSKIIKSAKLISGENNISTSSEITNDYIAFSDLESSNENSFGYIADDKSKNFSLQISFFDNLDYRISQDKTLDNIDLTIMPTKFIDNKSLSFSLKKENIVTQDNSSAIKENQTEIVSGTDKNKIDINATKLEFVRQPSESSFVGKNFARQPEIIATDNAGNIDKDFKEECSKIRIVDELSSSDGSSSSPLVIINDSDNTPIANNELNFNEGKISFANYKIKYTSTATNTRLKIELVNKDGCYQNEIAPIYSEQFSVSTGKGVGFSIINDKISENIARNDDVKVFEFEITDDNLSTQDDGLPTRLSQITITKGSTDELDWSKIIKSAKLISGENNIISSGITNNSIAFSDLESSNENSFGYIADNDSKDFSLKISFFDNLDYRISQDKTLDNIDLTIMPTKFIDNKSLSFSLKKENIATQDNSSAIREDQTEIVSGIDKNKININARKLEFARQPVNGLPNLAFNDPQPIVIATDDNGNIDRDFNSEITIENNKNISMQNTPTAFINGKLVFQDNFSFEGEDNDITLTITTKNTPNISIESNLFNIKQNSTSTISFNNDPREISYEQYVENQSGDMDNKIMLGEFVLKDDGGDNDGGDNLSTIVTSFELEITNIKFLKKLYLIVTDPNDGETILKSIDIDEDVTNNILDINSFKIEAVDGGEINFGFYGLFNPDFIVDNEKIGIKINKIGLGRGSLIDLNKSSLNVPEDYNTIIVKASKFVFKDLPPILGKYSKPTNDDQTASVRAVDKYEVLDVDFNSTNVTISVEKSDGSIEHISDNQQFEKGIYNINNIEFPNTVKGKLIFKDEGLSIEGKTTNEIDVINTVLTNVKFFNDSEVINISNRTSNTLLSMTTNASTLNDNYPILKEISINFEIDNLTTNISDLFEEFKIYKYTASGSETPTVSKSTELTETTNPSISHSIYENENKITFHNIYEKLDSGKNTTFFVVCDIKSSANETNFNVSLSEKDIVMENSEGLKQGSITYNNENFANIGTITSNKISIKDDTAPKIIKLSPFGKNINIGENLQITFDEPIYISSSNLENIFLTLTNKKDNNTTTKINLKEGIVFPTSTLDFQIDGLLMSQTEYSISYSPNFANTIYDKESGGISLDLSGFETWEFSTIDDTAPKFIDSTPIIENILPNGFNLRVQLDEEGKVYYSIKSASDTHPKTVNDIISEGNIINVNKFKTNYSVFIGGLNPDTEYTVYTIAQDNVTPANNSADKKIIEKTSTSGNTNEISFSNPNLTICEGDFQEITEPILITETGNSGFEIGEYQYRIDLPDPFEFDTSDNNKPTVDFWGGDISTVKNESPTITIESSSLATLTFTINSTTNNDYFAINGLKIRARKYTEEDKNITISGTNIQSKDKIAVINLSKAIEPKFKIGPTGSKYISVKQEAVNLYIDNIQELDILGKNEFFGKGVDGKDGIYNFNTSFAKIGTHTITLKHTTRYGCAYETSQEVVVYDADLYIPQLKTIYCKGSGDVTIEFNKASNIEGSNEKITKLLINTDSDTNAKYVNNSKEEIDLTNDLVIEENTTTNRWIIKLKNVTSGDIKFDAEISRGVGQSSTNISKVISIIEPPELSFGINGNTKTDVEPTFCVDGNKISLDGTVTGINEGITFDHKFGFDLDNNDEIDENTIEKRKLSTLINDDNLKGKAEIDLKNFNFGDKTNFGKNINLIYSVVSKTNNDNDELCSNFVKRQININPLPKPEIDISGSLCEDRKVTFESNSTLTNSNNDNLSYIWDFGDINNTAKSTEKTTTRTFKRNKYKVQLTVSNEINNETICTAETSKNIYIGAIPKTQFDYTGVNFTEPIIFKTNTINQKNTSKDDMITKYSWKFNESDVLDIPLKELSITEQLKFKEVSNEYTGPYNGNVSLTVTTENGCDSTFTKPIYVLDTFNISQSNGFNLGSEGWVTFSKNDVESSWKYDVENNLWTSKPVEDNYEESEKFVYSPSISMKNLNKPVIEFYSTWDLELGSGVIFQYSKDNLNIRDTNKKWITLGSKNSGINWYNSDELTLNLDNNTELNSAWANEGEGASFHAFDEESLDFVNFRFGILSNSSNMSKSFFKFDDFFIGERLKNIVIENFTNTSKGSDTKKENEYLKNLTSNSSFTYLNYHTDFPGEDPINKANRIDIGARALYYNIKDTPTTILDGIIKDNDNRYFSQWGKKSLELRSLIINHYDIDLTVEAIGNKIHIEAKPEALNEDVLNEDVSILAVVYEKTVKLSDLPNIDNVNSGEEVFNNVVRKLLPNAAGITLDNAVLRSNYQNNSSNENYSISFEWVPKNVIDINNLAVVVIIQNTITKEIYQSYTMDVSDNIIVTSTISNELKNQEIIIHPNPADVIMHIDFPKIMIGSKSILFDSKGNIVKEFIIESNTVSIDVSLFPSGLYQFNCVDKNGNFNTKKFLISR